jgi:uncharacterized repeat protein (TIGR01451 family)
MARLSQVSLRFAFALIAGFQLDTHLKSSSGSFGIAPAFAATAPGRDPKDDVAARARLSSSYGKLPISFEPNQGQTASVAQYLARGAGYTLFLTPGEMVLELHSPLPGTPKRDGAALKSATMLPPVEEADSSAAVSMRLIGSNKSARALGVDPLPGKSNYFIGSNPAKWHVNVPTYAKVRFHGMYPGIDLVYYGNQEGKLEHDFLVAPGADPHRIEFDLSDDNRTPTLNHGELSLHTKAGDIRLQAPLAYQVIRGETTPVAASYQADSGHIRFRLGSYDSHYPLIIDPVLVYSAVFGGSSNDYVQAMTVDAERNVYVTGATYSNDFPLANPYQATPGLGFVSKLNSSGTALVYSTYLGGGKSYGEAIVVDASGRAYISGLTKGGLPIVNAYQPTFGGGYYDAFITVLNPAGNALEWSTYLGGPTGDFATAMALDSSGNVYVTGDTDGGFPELHNIPSAQCAGGGQCIWVAKFNGAGALQYSTLYGAGASAAIAADSNGSAYITGIAIAPALTTPGAFRSTCTTAGCALVAKLSPTGDSLVYSTTLGTIPANGAAIAVDSGLNAYVGGSSGPGLPVWSTGFQRTYGGGSADGMVIKLNPTGTNLIWSTYLGGSGDDIITGLALDQYRQVYVSGYTTSPDFPLKSPIQFYTGTSVAPYQDFVATLSPSLSSIQYYSTYFGQGTYTAYNVAGAKIAVDPALNVYLAGQDQNNVQFTPGAYSAGSSRDIFISKLVIMDDLALAMSASSPSVSPGQALNYVISVTSQGPDSAVNVHVSDMLPAGTTLVSINCGGAAFAGTSDIPGCTLPQLDKGATWTVVFVVIVHTPVATTLSSTATVTSNMQDFVISNNSAVITTPVN